MSLTLEAWEWVWMVYIMYLLSHFQGWTLGIDWHIIVHSISALLVKERPRFCSTCWHPCGFVFWWCFSLCNCKFIDVYVYHFPFSLLLKLNKWVIKVEFTGLLCSALKFCLILNVFICLRRNLKTLLPPLAPHWSDPSIHSNLKHQNDFLPFPNQNSVKTRPQPLTQICLSLFPTQSPQRLKSILALHT